MQYISCAILLTRMYRDGHCVFRPLLHYFCFLCKKAMFLNNKERRRERNCWVPTTARSRQWYMPQAYSPFVAAQCLQENSQTPTFALTNSDQATGNQPRYDTVVRTCAQNWTYAKWKTGWILKKTSCYHRKKGFVLIFYFINRICNWYFTIISINNQIAADLNFIRFFQPIPWMCPGK